MMKKTSFAKQKSVNCDCFSTLAFMSKCRITKQNPSKQKTNRRNPETTPKSDPEKINLKNRENSIYFPCGTSTNI